MSSPRAGGARSSLLPRLSRSGSLVAVALLALLAAGDDLGGAPTKPTSEFHFVRMFYRDGGLARAYGFGYGNRSWTVDYPEAEYHFHLGVSRLTRVDIDDARVPIRGQLRRLCDDSLSAATSRTDPRRHARNRNANITRVIRGTFLPFSV